ncbi:ATP-binding cassette domain-containing protein [Aquabacterium sp. OR-4]|uniref:ATP-binding cassette domain-containing protein n=1 Tax=Aquabacterium sp. OR-4 TaxID=2978127 RepID=UPI0028C6C382|nr:ATP-binding cassette domain-containing protein [Aquabacterium sp. OR-4]MDT7838586.1 ATP-binding cassette domain-containing protein [Aquabacterium sp. OR-4]
MSALLEVRGARKAFGGVHAVDDLSFTLAPGEVLAVLGHNGAGKSTLMQMLAGALPFDGGELWLDGQRKIFDSPAASRSAGIETIHQKLALADNLDAVANLFLGRELRTRLGLLDDVAMRAAALPLLARLNPNFRNIDDPVKSLSGGQRQVVAIARALQFKARVLIMDEPCAALGPAETAMVHDLIRRLSAEGVGILLVTHDMPDVFALSHRLLVMKNGRQVGQCATSRVTEDEVLAMIISGKPPAALTSHLTQGEASAGGPDLSTPDDRGAQGAPAPSPTLQHLP